MKIFLAKTFLKPADIDFNYSKILAVYEEAVKDNCDLLIFGEMSITGFPVYDELLDESFIKKSDELLEKIVDSTKGKKTRILLGCPYFIKEHEKEGIIKKSELFNSVILINDGYIDSISSKTNISKLNLFNEYRYFDKEAVLKSINYENDNFDVLIDDDILENKNILYIKERDTDFVICLDCELQQNINTKKKQLIKIAKWTGKNIIYLNNLSYDIKNEYSFLGESFVVNNIGEIIYENESINEDLLKFETNIVNGKILIKNINKISKNMDFFDIIANNYKEKTIICEITGKNSLPKSKNIKLITFDEKLKDENVEFVNYKNYAKNIKLDGAFKNIIMQNLSIKNKVDFFLKR
ncbi:MAG TPA: nitrilase-related carbon-nitrogen hydrolase [Rickettsiales bacterium]|nr:nitrilase-related carbon-nitrogen hydrolase [Rickettsiales bacterium]